MPRRANHPLVTFLLAATLRPQNHNQQVRAECTAYVLGSGNSSTDSLIVSGKEEGYKPERGQRAAEYMREGGGEDGEGEGEGGR